MDDFSDDGFDDLNDNVLQELENNAIESTQARKLALSQAAPPVRNLYAPHQQQPPQKQPQSRPQPQPQPEVFDLFDDDELDDTIVIDELAPNPGHAIEHPRLGPSLAQPGQQRWNQQSQAQRAVLPPRPPYRPPPPPRPAHIPIPSQRYPRPPIPPNGLPHRPSPAPPQSQFARPPVPIPRPYAAQQSQVQALHAATARKENDIAAALQARLSALEAELTATKGEASILRSKYDKATKTHDAEINRLKKQNAEQLAMQEKAIEAARNAEQTAATELQFARQDLKAELGRTKPKKKDGATTPKRGKTWGQPDGFDGLEILASPSKVQAQRRKDSAGATGSALAQGERTPSKGKRKRPVVDSPSFALETESEAVPFQDATEHQKAKTQTSRVLSDELPFDFLRLVLDHSPLNGQPLTFDLFSRFAFPSQASQTFAATIFQKLPHMGSAQEPSRLLVQFANLMIDMWQQCLSERYHPPIYYLAALLAYTIQLNSAAVAPHIISTLVPVCATTCRLVALPRYTGNISDHPDDVIRQLLLDIDVTQSLGLLYMTALGCLSLSPCSNDADQDQDAALVISPQTEFWTTMELDFVMVMLSPKHPEHEWFGMLSLLWTSVLPTSIGPIPNPASSATYLDNGRAELETRELVANGIIDKVSSFLSEPPYWALEDSEKDVIGRLSVLKTLILFATSDFGAVHLASSAVALPRIVTVLCWGIDMLYEIDMSSSLPDVSHTLAPGKKTAAQKHDAGTESEPVVREEDMMQLDPPPVEPMSIDGPDGPAKNQASDGDDQPEADEGGTTVSVLLCQLIKRAMLLVHTLVTDPRTADLANINAKLAASYAGSQRYLITLARLNFAEEDLVLEKGIDAETVELAHELLELAVTPDEGEGLGELFGF